MLFPRVTIRERYLKFYLYPYPLQPYMLVNCGHTEMLGFTALIKLYSNFLQSQVIHSVEQRLLTLLNVSHLRTERNTICVAVCFRLASLCILSN